MGFEIERYRDKALKGELTPYEQGQLEYWERMSASGKLHKKTPEVSHSFGFDIQEAYSGKVGKMRKTKGFGISPPSWEHDKRLLRGGAFEGTGIDRRSYIRDIFSGPFSKESMNAWGKIREMDAAVDAKEKEAQRQYEEARRKARTASTMPMQEISYNASPGQGFFTQGNPYEGFKISPSSLSQTRPIVSFDIETDDLGRPISISALKQVWNPKTQRLQTIDSLQRFYLSESRNLVSTEPVHGFTAKTLAKMRTQQGATYSERYNDTERQVVRDFFGNAIVAGHNVLDFDLRKLFGMSFNNQVIDTMIVSQNIWGNMLTGPHEKAKHGLDDMLKRVTGKSMAQMGLSHHDANADTVAAALILEQLLRGKGRSGTELRAMLQHPELMYGPQESLPYAKGGDRTTSLFIGGPRGFSDEGGVHAIENYYKAQDLLENINLLVNGKLQEGFDIPSVGFNFEEERITMEDKARMSTAMEEQVAHLERQISGVSALAEAFRELKKSELLSRRSSWIRTLSSVSPEDMEATAVGLDIPKADIGPVAYAAKAIRSERDFKTRFADLKRMYAGGHGGTVTAQQLRKELSRESSWGAANVQQLDRLEQLAEDKRFAQLMDNDRLSQSQKDYIEMLHDEGTSYDKLNGKIKELIRNNEQVGTFVTSLSSIRAYDPNQYVNSARSQWGSIMGAARGVVPSFLLDPLSRLGSAGFNAIDKGMVGYNRVMSVWNSGVGKAITSGAQALTSGIALGAGAGTVLGGPGVGTAVGAGAGAIFGLVKGASQVIGNYQQGKMEKIGYDIQNSLNTTGLIISWVSAPFKILAKVTKQLIGGFTALLAWLKRLMSSGIDLMSQMGNPLTELTGVNYANYQGANMMDIASLLSRGSTNSLYEKLATNQRGLFTMGQFDENALIASSMLGVFNEAYVPGSNTEQATNNMINKLLSIMSTQTPDQQARTMYLAGQIDSSIPQLLHSARLLGVTDINQLANPRSRGIYWNPLSENENQRFRWTQYEYGATQEGFNNSKMRVANYLWSAFGRDLYNGLNRTMDRVSSGDWKGAFDSVADMWDSFKKKIVGIWESFKAKLSEKDSNGMSQMDRWYNSFVVALDKIGIAGLKMLQVILKGWNELVGVVIKKSQGLIAYLSTLRIGVSFDNGKIGFNVESIGDRSNVKGSAKIARYDSEDTRWVNGEYKRIVYYRGQKGYGSLVDFAYANNLTVNDKTTVDSLRAEISSRVSNGKGQFRLGNEVLNIGSGEVGKLVDLLLMLGDNPTDMETAAAWFSSGFRPGSYQKILDTTGIGKTYNTLSKDLDSVFGTFVESTIQSLYTDSLYQHTLGELNININTNDKPAASGSVGSMTPSGAGAGKIQVQNSGDAKTNVSLESNKRG